MTDERLKDFLHDSLEATIENFEWIINDRVCKRLDEIDEGFERIVELLEILINKK